MSEEFVAQRAAELYEARVLSELAGALTGRQVVAAHKCVRLKLCAGKTGWDLLECVVDNMERVYRLTREKGFEAAMREVTCAELIPG